MTAAAVAAGIAVLATACGGSDDAVASDSSDSTARSVDFSLARLSDIGTKEAYVTFTSRSDGKTTAVVDFYVPRTPESRGDVYSVSVQSGACSSLGEQTISLGDLSAGVTVVVLDKRFDDAVAPLSGGESSLVIMKPDRKTVAWCGPTA
jgi:hypothetical protein